MFEWLENEIAEVKTPRFHVIDGPAGPEFKDIILNSKLPLPSSYREFVLKFGNAKLYRNSREGYAVVVFAGPREAVLKHVGAIYYIGFHDSASVYVKSCFNEGLVPVFEFEMDEEKAWDGFEEWLFESCRQARMVSGKRWKEILRGPKPFSEEEKELIETRRGIKWRVVGIDEQGNHVFEVKNLGNRSLHSLTIGVRSTDRVLNGAVRLDVGRVGPGKTELLHADCYKSFRQPEKVEAFPLPDPEPEDREFYYEFK